MNTITPLSKSNLLRTVVKLGCFSFSIGFLALLFHASTPQLNAAEETQLLYQHAGKTWQVHGILHGRFPFALVDGEQSQLPDGGRLVMEGFTTEHLAHAIPHLGFAHYRGPTGRPQDVPSLRVRFRSATEKKDESVLQQQYQTPWPPGSILLLTWFSEGQFHKPSIFPIYDTADPLLLHFASLVLELDNRLNRGIPLLFVVNEGVVLERRQSLDPLWQALLRNDSDGVQSLLEGGANPNRMIHGGWNSTHLAAILGNDAGNKLFASSQTNWESRDPNGWLPMHYAASTGSPALPSLIQKIPSLDESADSEMQGLRTITPLRLSVVSGSLPAFRQLLEAGARVQIRREDTPLLNLIIVYGRDDFIGLLEDHSIRYRESSRDREENLIHAIRTDRVNIVQFHLEQHRYRLDRPVRDLHVATLATTYASPEMLGILSENGAPLDIPVGSQGNLLHLAASSNPRVIPWLIENGVDPLFHDENGITPLRAAIINRCLDCVAVLLELGAIPSETEPREEETPLLWLATRLAQAETVRRLLAAGVTCDFDEETALRVMEDAFRYNIPEIFAVALAQCIEVDFSFDGGFPGWWVAQWHEADGILNHMLQLGLDPTAQNPPILANPNRDLSAPLQPQNTPLPHYPLELHAIHGDQEIVIDVIIDRLGRVRFPRILQNEVPEMERALLDSLRLWRFDPPQIPEDHQGVRVQIPIRLQGREVFTVDMLDMPPYATYQRELSINRSDRSKLPEIVMVRGIIDVDGRLIPRSLSFNPTDLPEAIEDAIIRTLIQWRFEPGRLGGDPVRTRVEIPLQFPGR